MFSMIKQRCRNGIFVVCFLLIGACSNVAVSPSKIPSTLNPHGPAAAHLAELWWVRFGFGTATFVLVISLLLAALLRGRRSTSATAPDNTGVDIGRNWPIWGGIVLPFVIIGIVFGYNIYTLAAVENPLNPPAVHIEVVGRRWWWEVKYPKEGVATANEIHIPVG